MSINDLLQILINPQIWPLFLTFLGGYVMMRVMLDREKLKDFSELEKILISFGIGVLFEHFIFYPIVTLATFWWPKIVENAYIFSVFLFCVISAIALLYRINGYCEVQIIRGTRKILIAMFVCLSIFVMFNSIVGWAATSWYEPYKLHIIAYGWNTYIGLNVVSIIIASAAFILFCEYLFKPLLREKLEIKCPPFTRRTIVTGVILIVVIVTTALAIVPIDKSINIFTPRMEIGEEVFSSKMMYEGSPIVLFIHAERVSQFNISAVYRFYGLMDKSHIITLPKIPLLSSVYINNPSNTSFLKGEEGAPFVSSSENWKRIYLDVPRNVSYVFDMIETTMGESKVAGVTVSFTDFASKSSFVANLTYWQEIPQFSGIEAEHLPPTYTDLGNKTWLEEYTFKIRNNSNKFLYISAFEFDRFAFAVVHRDSIKVYRNGQLVPYAELVTLRRLGLSMYLYPGYSMNITVSLVSDDVS